jgi:hypothetical protein
MSAPGGGNSGKHDSRHGAGFNEDALGAATRDAAVIDPDNAAQDWQTHGFAILPGLIPIRELAPALSELQLLLPSRPCLVSVRRKRLTAPAPAIRFPATGSPVLDGRDPERNGAAVSRPQRVGLVVSP